MVKNYLLVAYRNLLANKVYALINTLGLAVGLACCLLAVLVLRHEFSYDRFHSKGERIYRVLRERASGDERQVRWLTSGALAANLQADLPEVEQATKCRLYHVRMEYQGRVYENQVQGQVDAQFFSVFDFPFVRGDPQTALLQPYTAVITQTMARRLFGQADPIGQTVTLVERYYGGDYQITGVLKDLPEGASSLHFDLLHATQGQTQAAQEDWQSWQPRIQQAGIQTFVLLTGLLQKSGEGKMVHNLCDLPFSIRCLLNGPGQRLAQDLFGNGSTGLADGRQPFLRPRTRTAGVHLGHEQTVHYDYEVCVPGQALACTQLTVTQTQMLLAVPVKGFGAGPTLPIGFEDGADVPVNSIGDQDLGGLAAVFSVPQNHQADRMIHVGDRDDFGEIPLQLSPRNDRPSVGG